MLEWWVFYFTVKNRSKFDGRICMDVHAVGRWYLVTINDVCLGTSTNKLTWTKTIKYLIRQTKTQDIRVSAKMIQGVCTEKYVIHSTLFYQKNCELALLLIK